MVKNNNTQNFEMKNTILKYDPGKSTLLCLDKTKENKKIWIKKLMDISHVSSIIEDKNKYYIACESGEINGQFLALSKESGATQWFIPGKSFLQIIFEGFLYLIFVDESDRYYLLKVRRENGRASWHHMVDQDLYEYSFSKKKISLVYSSGKSESLSIRTGRAFQ